MNQTIRIVIADDHELLRSGFQVLLRKQNQVEIVAEAEDGMDLLNKVREHRPDVVVTDIQMPVMDGIEATRILASEFPETGVIALTMFNEDSMIVDMMESGAKGYLLKNTNKNELIDAIKAVYNGGTYFCAATTTKMAKLIGKAKFNPYRNTPEVKFTEKEMELLLLVCEGLQNKEIADRMNISIRTVEGYRIKLFEKTNTKHVAGLVIYAIKRGFYKV
jgi:DNA-binding NarL/FixJ family response regulator